MNFYNKYLYTSNQNTIPKIRQTLSGEKMDFSMSGSPQNNKFIPLNINKIQ